MIYRTYEYFQRYDEPELLSDLYYEYNKVIIKDNQEGGKIRVETINDIKYEINIKYGEILNDDVDGIRGETQTKKLIIVNFNNKNSLIMLIDEKNKEGDIRMIIKDKYKENIKKMIKIAIKYGKKLGLKKIKLLDHSNVGIGKNRFVLSRIRIMTEGETYYNKYKFYEKNDIKNRIYEHNKILNKKVKVGDMEIKKLVRKMRKNINDTEEENKFYDEIEKNKDKLLSKFIKENIIKYNNIFSNIYLDLYEEAGYKLYKTNTFIKIL